MPPFRHLLLLLPVLLLLTCRQRRRVVSSFPPSPHIQLNQIGYYPNRAIHFTVADTSRTDTLPDGLRFYALPFGGNVHYAQGRLERRDWRELTGLSAHTGRIDSLPRGRYHLYVEGVGYSAPFEVRSDIYRPALRASLRALYFQRASWAVPQGKGEKYARASGHPDDSVAFHPSSGYTSGTLESPGGWYDAGDYNKYVVNGAFPLAQLLSLYEDCGDPAPDGSLNIDESGNGQSDFLDEMLYEVDWLLTMQDSDGGLFHKLTTKQFESMDVMPAAATSPRFIVGKSTTATLDFAAAMALASRVLRPRDPARATLLLAAARRAWNWAVANPDRAFTNPPDISTGEYGDPDPTEEFAYAAAELYVATGDTDYLDHLREHPVRTDFETGGSWRTFMGNMATFTLLRHGLLLPKDYREQLTSDLLTLADEIVKRTTTTAYRQPIERFVWGSNSDVANAGMILAAAHRLSGEERYLDGLLDGLHYLLGHNPNAVSYLTGFGHRYPMNIHHRPSNADGVETPVPGLLSGGPNVGRQDRQWCTYRPGAAPMMSWTDQTGSYASNEICLNWNAPLTYVLGYVEAECGR